MNTFFENLTISIKDAISMEKGEIQMKKKFEDPAPTYVAVGTERVTESNHS